MMRSLFSGVSGLKVHQTKMDVIGNNIANVNTVGFKSSTVTFSDIFYQTSQSASGPNAATGMGGQNARQIGLGSTLGSIAVNITGQGGSQRTDNPFDMMINGDAFFIVNKGGTNYFTKAGNFNVDEAGTLVNSSGYPVMGWQADSNGTIQKERVSALQVMAEKNMSTPPEATTQSTFFGNIDEEDDQFEKDIPYIPLQMSFYDSLGYEYQAMFKITQPTTPGTGTGGTGGTGTGGAAATTDGKTRTYTLALDEILKDGKVIASTTGDGTTIQIITAPTVTLRFNTDKADYKDTTNNRTVAPGELIDATVATPGTPPTAAAGTGGRRITIDFSNVKGLQATELIEIDLSQITNYGSASTIDTEKGIDGLNKGKAPGEMSRLGVQTDGKIVASYTNGDQRILGQIAVANFANAAGLEKIGENLYAETLNSGSFNGIGEDITANGDKFSTGVLEMSNVDLSTEFVDMITTQRGFQANSRIITVSDTMLEELINLKR